MSLESRDAYRLARFPGLSIHTVAELFTYYSGTCTSSRNDAWRSRPNAETELNSTRPAGGTVAPSDRPRRRPTTPAGDPHSSSIQSNLSPYGTCSSLPSKLEARGSHGGAAGAPLLASRWRQAGGMSVRAPQAFEPSSPTPWLLLTAHRASRHSQQADEVVTVVDIDESTVRFQRTAWARRRLNLTPEGTGINISPTPSVYNSFLGSFYDANAQRVLLLRYESEEAL